MPSHTYTLIAVDMDSQLIGPWEIEARSPLKAMVDARNLLDGVLYWSATLSGPFGDIQL